MLHNVRSALIREPIGAKEHRQVVRDVGLLVSVGEVLVLVCPNSIATFDPRPVAPAGVVAPRASAMSTSQADVTVPNSRRMSLSR
jgi:ABC-type lipopolysaccharide export system ATPase subunit